MRAYINADSLAFITIDGLYRALGDERNGLQPQRCDACFTGDYPTTDRRRPRSPVRQRLPNVAGMGYAGSAPESVARWKQK